MGIRMRPPRTFELEGGRPSSKYFSSMYECVTYWYCFYSWLSFIHTSTQTQILITKSSCSTQSCIKKLWWKEFLFHRSLPLELSSHLDAFKKHLGGISLSVLSVFFTDNCYKLLKSLHLIGWEQICQWKTLTKRLMKCPPPPPKTYLYKQQ